MLIAYEGTRYSGFQVQPAVPTVQGAIEDALAQILRQPVRIACAGRTDAGVHATGQVVSFDIDSDIEPERLHRSLNGVVADDISVLDVAIGPDGFHARHSAVARSYVYLVNTGLTRQPFIDRFSAHDSRGVDPQIADAAVRRFVGERDFTSFVRLAEDDNPVRSVLSASATANGDVVSLSITAKSFLHQMVRGIVGSVLEVAVGRRELSWIDEVFEAKDRAAAGPVAVPRGLALTGVKYADANWTNTSDVWPWSNSGVAA